VSGELCESSSQTTAELRAAFAGIHIVQQWAVQSSHDVTVFTNSLGPTTNDATGTNRMILNVII